MCGRNETRAQHSNFWFFSFRIENRQCSGIIIKKEKKTITFMAIRKPSSRMYMIVQNKNSLFVADLHTLDITFAT